MILPQCTVDWRDHGDGNGSYVASALSSTTFRAAWGPVNERSPVMEQAVAVTAIAKALGCAVSEVLAAHPEAGPLLQDDTGRAALALVRTTS